MAKLIDSVRDSLPEEWTYHHYYFDEMELVDVCCYSSEFTRITSIIGDRTPTSIVRVENPYIWGLYLLKKEECEKRCSNTEEKELWHVTDPSFIDSIATSNFDWRRSHRARYGQGVCFSPDLNHALRYSTYGGAAILAKVLVGDCCDGDCSTEMPPVTSDTTTGWGGNVFVKYTDNEFYPAYVAYF